MTDQHRATPEQWSLVASEAADCSATHSCILELRDRIAALWEEMRDRTDTLAAADGDTTSLIFKVTNRIEALECNAATPEPRPASAEAQPAGGLVEPEITRRELARIWNDNQDSNEESGDAMARLYSAGFHAGMKWQAELMRQEAANG
jgi:hypothetical protein